MTNKEFYERYKYKKIKREQIRSKTIGEPYEKWDSRRGHYDYYYVTGYEPNVIKISHTSNDHHSNYFKVSDISFKENNLNW